MDNLFAIEVLLIVVNIGQCILLLKIIKRLQVLENITGKNSEKEKT